jgi:hypothetical protein
LWEKANVAVTPPMDCSSKANRTRFKSLRQNIIKSKEETLTAIDIRRTLFDSRTPT